MMKVEEGVSLLALLESCLSSSHICFSMIHCSVTTVAVYLNRLSDIFKFWDGLVLAVRPPRLVHVNYMQNLVFRNWRGIGTKTLVFDGQILSSLSLIGEMQ